MGERLKRARRRSECIAKGFERAFHRMPGRSKVGSLVNLVAFAYAVVIFALGLVRRQVPVISVLIALGVLLMIVAVQSLRLYYQPVPPKHAEELKETLRRLSGLVNANKKTLNDSQPYQIRSFCRHFGRLAKQLERWDALCENVEASGQMLTDRLDREATDRGLVPPRFPNIGPAYKLVRSRADSGTLDDPVSFTWEVPAESNRLYWTSYGRGEQGWAVIQTTDESDNPEPADEVDRRRTTFETFVRDTLGWQEALDLQKRLSERRTKGQELRDRLAEVGRTHRPIRGGCDEC